MPLDRGGENRKDGMSLFPFLRSCPCRCPTSNTGRLFAKGGETESFAAAAADLGLSAATVSKALKRLEARTGERLIHRTSRRFALTEAGRALAVHAAPILAAGGVGEA